MKFTRELPGALTIHSVDANGIRIDDRWWSQAIALTPHEFIDSWQSVPLQELTEDNCAALLQHNPELVIVGTGTHSVFPTRQLMFAFARRGVGLELMDTAAAARTFNVLAGEGRRVAAIMYPL